MNAGGNDTKGLWLRFAIAALCGLLAAWVRSSHAIGVRYTVPPAAEGAAGISTWGSYDPDTLYHARRVARGVEAEGWIAANDPLLAHPQPPGSQGAPIPWPPAYDLLLTGIARGALPNFARLEPRSEDLPPVPVGASEQARIERLVATVPLVWGSLAAVLAALVAGGLVAHGRRSSPETTRAASLIAAAVAGVTVALTFAHVRYSHLGNGDHHAFVSLLHLALLGVCARALRPRALDQPVWSATRGAVAGLLAGLLITSWTASILFVALVQAALVIRLFRRYRTPEGAVVSARGLPLFATSFHKAALLVVLPGTIHSPFTFLTPWSLVELSWLHTVWLAIGWLVFSPYALVPRLARTSRAAALGPALLIAAIVVVATPVGTSLRDAFSWAGAANPFMASITESQPLLGGEAGSFAALVKHAGAGVLLAPVLVVWLAIAAFRWATPLPWALTLPVLVVAAVLQRRFAESLTPVLAVALGAGLAAGAAPLLRRLGSGGRAAAVVVAAALAVAAHPWTLRNTLAYRAEATRAGGRFASGSPPALRERALAEMLTAMGARAPARSEGAFPAEDPGASRGVLAQWDLGHAIEWRAGLPTVADNFGLYLGEASFLAPWRFLGEVDDERAERLLQDFDVRYVLVDGDRNRSAMARALELPLDSDPELWRRTMAARLLRDGAGADPLPAPDFLRLVALHPDGSGGRLRLFEVVSGARLRAYGRSLSVVATFTGTDSLAVSGEASPPVEVWRASVAASDPSAPDWLELRVPYAPSEGVTLEVFVDGASAAADLTDRNVIEGTRVFAGEGSAPDRR